MRTSMRKSSLILTTVLVSWSHGCGQGASEASGPSAGATNVSTSGGATTLVGGGSGGTNPPTGGVGGAPVGAGTGSGANSVPSGGMASGGAPTGGSPSGGAGTAGSPALLQEACDRFCSVKEATGCAKANLTCQGMSCGEGVPTECLAAYQEDLECVTAAGTSAFYCSESGYPVSRQDVCTAQLLRYRGCALGDVSNGGAAGTGDFLAQFEENCYQFCLVAEAKQCSAMSPCEKSRCDAGIPPGCLIDYHYLLTCLVSAGPSALSCTEGGVTVNRTSCGSEYFAYTDCVRVRR
jgi:hypothetical protein